MEMTLNELKQIKIIVRYGKNGRKYIWKNTDITKTQKLIAKYKIDEICFDGTLWLQS